MQAEIITIGTELLLGEIVDTNSAWMARELTRIGLNLYYKATVGDNLRRATDSIRASLERSDVVITTGGLGPTVDDVTRDAIAAATGRELVLDEDLLEEIAGYFRRRNHPMTGNNRKQAQIPAGAQVIHNPVGTAPCFAVEHGGHVVIALPGVPHEMKHLMEHEVIPLLRERFGLTGVIRSRTLRTCGIGESNIDSRIGDLMEGANPTVGTAAHPGQTDVRITAKADSEAEVLALIGPVETALRARLGDHVFGVDQETLGEVVARLLCERGLRLAVVETTTTGEIAQSIARSPQGPDALAGGTVIPRAEAVPQTMGFAALPGRAAGQEMADRAAEAVRVRMGADYGLAVVGPTTGPEMESEPVYFSLARAGSLRRAPERKGRSGVSGLGWLMHLALDLVRRELLGLPDAEG